MNQTANLSHVAVYLADREALAGRARDSFLRLLAEGFHYRDTHARVSPWLWLVAALAGGAGLACDAWRHDGALGTVHLLGWAAWSGVAGLLAATAPRRQRVAHADFELHWLVYCQLVRPVILHERPGLLDRNATTNAGATPPERLTPSDMARLLWTEARGELARAALWGLWLGLGVFAVWRPAEAGWLRFAPPLLGAGLAPLAWAGWQWIAYRTVIDDPRVRDASGD